MSKKYTFAQEVCIRSSGKVIHKTDMLWPMCRVGVALSGGVDSFVLLKTLLIRQRILPFSFEIIVFHLNPGFVPDNHAALFPWLLEQGVSAHIETCTFGVEAHSYENRKKSPCFRCAWLRRKRLFELCLQYRLTHLAFGHNADDLISTFFMNLCLNGRVEGMMPNESFFRGSLRVIRPLLFVEKKYIKAAARQWNLPIIANPCPTKNATARTSVHDMLATIFSVSKDARRCITNALSRWQMDASFTENTK